MASKTSREVILNVYDLGENGGSGFLRALGLGAYHSGVEISGAEYTFSEMGIFFHLPKKPTGPRGQAITFRTSIVLGVHQGTSNDVHAIITRLRESFGPGSYNVINHNCNSFSDAFAKELVGVGIPSWVNRPASIGSFFFPHSGRVGSNGRSSGNTSSGSAASSDAKKKKELSDRQRELLQNVKKSSSRNMDSGDSKT